MRHILLAVLLVTALVLSSIAVVDAAKGGKGKGKWAIESAPTVTSSMVFQRWEGRLAAGDTVEHTLENTLDNADLLAALNWGWMDAETVCNFIVTDPEGVMTPIPGRPWQPNLAFGRPAPALQGEWTFAARNLSDRAIGYNVWARFIQK